MRVLVINLARRTDRRERMENLLSAAKFTEWSFIDGLDAGQMSCHPVSSLVSINRFCIWQSHVRAMQEIADGQEEFGLILEDDAYLDPNLNWNALLPALETSVGRLRLDKLQIGHISAAYKVGSLRHKVLGKWGSRSSATVAVDLGTEARVADLGVHRPGSHAYILSRSTARLLPPLNNPTWASPDAFFDRIASASLEQGRIRMGSLRKSLVEQQSRTSHRSKIDSDNSA